MGSNQIIEPQQWSSVLRSLQLPLSEYGIEVTELLNECNISIHELEHPHGLIPLSHYINFLNKATLEADDPLLCIKLSKLVGPEFLGAVGFLFWSSATLYEGLSAVCHYQTLFQDFTNTYLQKEGDYYIFGYEIYGMKRLDTRFDVEFSIALHYRLVRLFSNNKIECSKINFRHTPSIDVAKYKQLLACPCYFGQDQNAVYIKSSDLFGKNPHSDPALTQILKDYLDQDLLSKKGVQTFADNVKKIILSNHDEQFITAKVIAERIGISIATLYRRLKQENTTVKSILDDINAELSRKYLRETTLHIYQIGNILNYSSAAAFTRAFISWNNGLTPQQYRASFKK